MRVPYSTGLTFLGEEFQFWESTFNRSHIQYIRIQNVLHACFACLYEHIYLIYVIYSVLQRPFQGGKLLFNVCSTSLYDKKANSGEKVISSCARTQSAFVGISAVCLRQLCVDILIQIKIFTFKYHSCIIELYLFQIMKLNM